MAAVLVKKDNCSDIKKKINALTYYIDTLSNINVSGIRCGAMPFAVGQEHLVVFSKCAVIRRNMLRHMNCPSSLGNEQDDLGSSIQGIYIFLCLIHNFIYLWPPGFICLFIYLAGCAIFKIQCAARICYDKTMYLNMQLFLVAHVFLRSSV